MFNMTKWFNPGQAIDENTIDRKIYPGQGIDKKAYKEAYPYSVEKDYEDIPYPPQEVSYEPQPYTLPDFKPDLLKEVAKFCKYKGKNWPGKLNGLHLRYYFSRKIKAYSFYNVDINRPVRVSVSVKLGRDWLEVFNFSCQQKKKFKFIEGGWQASITEQINRIDEKIENAKETF